VVIQDLIIVTNNIKYQREVHYSPSQKKSYRGELPEDVRGKGEYGPGIRALIPILKAEGNMSEKRILGFFKTLALRFQPLISLSNGLAVMIFFTRKKAIFTVAA